MALWQLDAFEYRLTDMRVVTIYQLLDDATRFDVGTTACVRPENSLDAKMMLERAIQRYGAPQELLEHTPATEPIPMAVLEARAAEYQARRRLQRQGAHRADLMVMKGGTTAQNTQGAVIAQSADEAIVETTKANRQVYFHGLRVKLPVKYGGREFFRTITDDEFLLVDPRSGEVVFSFPVPMVALRVRGRYVNSYAIRGVFLAEPGAYWQRKYEECQVLFDERGDDAERLFQR